MNRRIPVLRKGAGLGLLFGLFVASAAAETGIVARATPLLQEPYSDAAVHSELAPQTAVQVLARKGAWMQVRVGEAQGWVRLLAVRMQTQGTTGASGLAQAANVALSGSSGTAVATGVRGLDQEQIANATPDLAAVDGMDAHAASAEQAQAFAAEAPGLQPQTLDELKR